MPDHDYFYCRLEVTDDVGHTCAEYSITYKTRDAALKQFDTMVREQSQNFDAVRRAQAGE